MESNILWEYPVKEHSRLKDQFQGLLHGDSDQGLNPRNLYFSNSLNDLNLQEEMAMSVLYYLKYHGLLEH